MSEADDVTPRRTGLYGALRRALDRRGADRAVVVISLVLMAFCLDTGLAADDFIHKLIATGSTEIQGFVREPLDMFRFTSGHHTGQLQDDGILSWWAHPRGKLAFLRPLTSLTHYLDYQLWPEAEWMMHLHSLLWGALLLAGLLVLYRELITPRWVCALAMFLYALEDGRAWFGSWIAARNGVIACAISIWALVLHHRTRSSNFRPGYLFSPLVLLLALLSGEGAVAICAYLFAYAIFLDRGSLRERLLSIVPHAVVVVLWRAAYRAMGYGAAHSGLYFDPIAETPSFLHALSERAPILLFSQVGGTWSDGWSAVFPFPTLHRLLVWGSIFTVLVVGYALVPLWKRDATVRFGLTGALLSVIPASAAFSADRLLTWVAIGASIAIARLMAAYIDAPQVLSHSPVRALIMPPLMIFLFVGNVIIDPLFLPSRARGNVAMRDIIDRAHAGVPDDPSIAERHVIYVNPAAVPLAAYIPIERAARGEPRPQRQMWLATSES
ncbi:MAG: hypothetical protein PVI30_25655, partial [Myxococcales bacterium]